MKYEVGDMVAFVGKVIQVDESDNANNYNEYYVQQGEPWFSSFRENELQTYVDIDSVIAKIEERINEVIEKEKTYATAEPFVAPETYWGELKGLEFALKALKGE